MLTSSFIFAVLCFAFILLFFSGLPNLRTCKLPSVNTTDEPDSIRDRLAVVLITVLYAGSAFWNLGNVQSPQTFTPMQGRSVVLSLSQGSTPKQLILFPGVGQGNYSIEYSSDAEGWYPLTDFTQDHVSVLKWQYIPLDLSQSVNFLRIDCISGSPWLGELMLRDSTGNEITVSSTAEELTDESYCVPEASNYMNSTYFDEIYHVRTAWEHLHGVWPYEISHPPLGKEIISIGILLFGMTPFGWRFSGNVAGIMILPAMYHFLLRLFGKGRIPILGVILTASGFLHYTQTRIATVDSFSAFFILIMYDYMYRWLEGHRIKDLAICAIAFGFGAACKWTCLYAGAGLAVLWIVHWAKEFCEQRRKAVRLFLKNTAACILLFVIIPGVIYYLSYLPYGISENANLFSRDYARLVLDNQLFMFRYHANIVAEHPYSSRWYQWILDLRPILYYLEYLPGGKRISIAAFVNPLICWGGLMSILLLIITSVFRRDRKAAFLLVAYLSGLVPWFFISRLTFMYHYFASAMFLVPAICYVYSLIENNTVNGKWYSTGYTVVTFMLFCCFFPVLNGMVVNNDLASRLLGWLPSWPI